MIAFLGCSESSQPSSSTAPSFVDGVCTSITEWGNRIVDAANAFTDESPHLSVNGRRARYLFAFDEQQRITDDLRSALEAAPSNGISDASGIRDELVRAVGNVSQNILDSKAEAVANVDFHFIGPKPDRLFAGTEKSLSLMLKPLDEVSRQRNVAGLGGPCGR
jgi:hypothetical protein